ncbi:enoyl-[acyl-carrier-protein] reductase FabK [Desulfuribacillus alkaliarsenatis]|uniref:Probable nitronate monooxygenase n=1 Tax=Desulfuribacillus alkaliarsenatis TaxID=766136 RepID=A0A1E5G5U0_9FIRM|nr:enoyl-[acyl-carrier-protein] reductase FabK [Desulfuribacillus alkaliarsenatis]OEF98558.1 2-nitropropane dioxygenase [Desulfuribacillus alkaliarsenatis]
MKTKITELLGIEYPIIQGGMAWIANGDLALAVSKAGGLGTIGAGSAPAEWVRGEIQKVKSLTDKPFAVNIMLLSPHAKDVVDVVIEEQVPIVTTGAGNPGIFMKRFKEAGIKVIPVVPSVALAKRLEKLGVDALIVEGMEAGGHIGELTTMALVPQVVDAVNVPVIAAGGMADGRGLVAALALGAEGVQFGTRFIVAHECTAPHQNYKEAIIKASDRDTVVTGRPTGHPVRVIRNKLTREYQELEKSGASKEELESFGIGKYRMAVEGDIQHGSILSGQIAGMVTKQESVAEIIEDIMATTKSTLERVRAVN